MIEAILLLLVPIAINLLTWLAKFIGRQVDILKGKWDVRLVSAVIAFGVMSVSGLVDSGIVEELAMAFVAFLASQGTFFLAKK